MSLYHISLPCTNLKASEEFYATVLQPLGYKSYLRTRNKTFFRPSWSFHPELSLRRDRSCGPIGGTRITIHASSRSQVDRFYVLGLYVFPSFLTITSKTLTPSAEPNLTTSKVERLTIIHMHIQLLSSTLTAMSLKQFI